MKNKILFVVGYIFGRKQFYTFGLVLQHIAHRMMGIGNYENTSLSGENYVVKLISNHMKNKNKIIFIDVGAGSNSENTELVLEYFPKSTCYLFEPIKNTFKKLEEKYLENKNIHCFELAVGESNKSITLWDYSSNSSQHATQSRKSIESAGREISKKTIKQVSLSSFLNRKEIKKVDFLKTDIEGYDYFALKGLQSKLKDVSFIQFEFNSMNGYSDVTFKKFVDLLVPSFKIYRMYQNGLQPIEDYNPIYDEIFEFQNYLAINVNQKVIL